MTLALSVIIPVSVMIYSNSRVSEVSKRLDDTNTNLGKRITDLDTSLNKRLDDMETRLTKHIDNAFEHMQLLLELHEAKHHKN